MSTIEQYDTGIFPDLMMSEAGTAGDLIYLSTGSGARLASNTNAGTENTNAFIGVLIDTTAAGSMGAVATECVVQLDKDTTTDVIDLGDQVYADGAEASNEVMETQGGTALGVCVKRSGSTDERVSVKLIPFYLMGVGGFHA